MQKRAVRHMCGVAQRSTCRPLFKKLCILTFPCLYIYSLLVHVKRSGYNLRRRDFHSYNTRTKDSLQEPYDRLTITMQNPKHIGIKMFNHLSYLDQGLAEAESLNLFKRKLKGLLIERGYYSVEEFLSDRARV